MNLTIDPWIPAVRADGDRELFSLQELFAQAQRAPRPRRETPRARCPDAAFGSASRRSRSTARRMKSNGKIVSHSSNRVSAITCRRWQAAFELFGDGERFLQVSNLQPSKEADEGNAATKLDLTLATGNNSTIFDNLAGEDRRSSERSFLP